MPRGHCWWRRRLWVAGWRVGCKPLRRWAESVPGRSGGEGVASDGGGILFSLFLEEEGKWFVFVFVLWQDVEGFFAYICSFLYE